jgi:GDP-D-mannose dehydratase
MKEMYKLYAETATEVSALQWLHSRLVHGLKQTEESIVTNKQHLTVYCNISKDNPYTDVVDTNIDNMVEMHKAVMKYRKTLVGFVTLTKHLIREWGEGAYVLKSEYAGYLKMLETIKICITENLKATQLQIALAYEQCDKDNPNDKAFKEFSRLNSEYKQWSKHKHYVMIVENLFLKPDQ